MQKRIRIILDLQNTDIIIDLKINNGFCDTKFEWNILLFFLKKKFIEV